MLKSYQLTLHLKQKLIIQFNHEFNLEITPTKLKHDFIEQKKGKDPPQRETTQALIYAPNIKIPNEINNCCK